MTRSGAPKRTFTVALVGADGAGKSSVIERILQTLQRPLVTVYMGPAIGSADHALPTSRLVARLKRRRLGTSGDLPPNELMSEDQRQRIERGRLIKALGLLNRVAEEWYRQLLIGLHRLRGRSVLCDRHFLYDYCPARPRPADEILSVRIHDWLLQHTYPRPNMTLFLDAPAEILHARKPEWTPEYLEGQRERIRIQGAQMPRFVVIDASQPLDQVVADCRQAIERLASGEPEPA